METVDFVDFGFAGVGPMSIGDGGKGWRRELYGDDMGGAGGSRPDGVHLKLDGRTGAEQGQGKLDLAASPGFGREAGEFSACERKGDFQWLIRVTHESRHFNMLRLRGGSRCFRRSRRQRCVPHVCAEGRGGGDEARAIGREICREDEPAKRNCSSGERQ